MSVSSKSYKGPQTVPRYDGSEVFENLTPGTIAMLQTYPAMKRRFQKILDGEWVATSYFQPLASGRQCSCWGTNSSPSGACRVCYKTGIVGGYSKYGTDAWVLDATHPELKMSNLKLLTAKEGPVLFGLDDQATKGELIVTGWFSGSGSIDVLESLLWEETGRISISIRTPAATTWLEARTATVDSLLATPQRFDIRVTFDRPSLSAATPLFAKLLIRRHLNDTDSTEVKANRPRGTHAMALTDIGVLDEWTSERWWLDATLQNLTSNDWFYDRANAVRWKIVDTEKFAPQNYLLSWDATVRKVQDFEPIIFFPV